MRPAARNNFPSLCPPFVKICFIFFFFSSADTVFWLLWWLTLPTILCSQHLSAELPQRRLCDSWQRTRNLSFMFSARCSPQVLLCAFSLLQFVVFFLICWKKLFPPWVDRGSVAPVPLLMSTSCSCSSGVKGQSQSSVREHTRCAKRAEEKTVDFSRDAGLADKSKSMSPADPGTSSQFLSYEGQKVSNVF